MIMTIIKKFSDAAKLINEDVNNSLMALILTLLDTLTEKSPNPYQSVLRRLQSKN